MTIDAVNVADRAEGCSSGGLAECVSAENQVNRLPQSRVERDAQAATNALLPPLDFLPGEPQPNVMQRSDRQPAVTNELPTDRRPPAATERPAQFQQRPGDANQRQPQRGDRSNGELRTFEPSRDGRGSEYQVRRGDTLWDISRDYLRNHGGNKYPSNRDIQDMVRRTARENGITNPSRICPGDRIRMPRLDDGRNAQPGNRAEQQQPGRRVEQQQPAPRRDQPQQPPRPEVRQPGTPERPRTDSEPRTSDQTEPGRPGDNLTGRRITDLDRNINPRLGCALAVSTALREVDPGFPSINNVRNLERTLRDRGYQAVPHQGPLTAADLREGDVIVGYRPGGMPGHAAIYRGDGRLFENNSETGMMTDKGDVNRFNQRMHDQRGRWQPNGFENVIILRRSR